MRRLVLLIPLIVGMSEPVSLPPEVKNLRAKVLDSKGVEHRLKGLFCNQGEALKFKKGSITYSLSLSSIKGIEVLGQEEGNVRVRVTLRNGKEEVFSLPSSVRCSGESDVGGASFYISEVKSIQFYQGEER